MNKQISILFLTLFFSIIVLANEQPNIVIILSDDIGFSDIGCYGGDANTPNLDNLAENGVRFTRFYNSARCMPTRASLLTGMYPQQAGIGHMTKIGDTREYQGFLKLDVPTIAERFSDIGYTTLHVGKWHVGNNYPPLTRGFDKGWFPVGMINFWNTESVYENGEFRDLVEDERQYLTDVEGNKAVEYIDYAVEKGDPFLLYLAFDAAHWPLHAKEEDIAKYRGQFMKGWDEMQMAKLKRIDSIGILSQVDTSLLKEEACPLWNTIPQGDFYAGYNPTASDKHDQDDWDLKMAVYAAMIDCMDQNIGKVITKLKETGVFDNTIIMFTQDNGACAEAYGVNDTNEPGTPESFISYGLPWAHYSNTPFRMYKHFVHEGGISTPFIFHWPEGISANRKGSIETNSIGHITDIVPTCLDAAGVLQDGSYDELEGLSLLGPINDVYDNEDRQLFFEHESNKAVMKGEWKLVSRYKNDAKFFDSWGFSKASRTQEWELYNIINDRIERNELSAQYPLLVDSLSKEYEVWADRIGVIDYSILLGDTAPPCEEEDNFYVVVNDFEHGFTGKSGTNGNDEGGLVTTSPYFTIVDNPHKTTLNPSDKVGKFKRQQSGAWWAYSWFEFYSTYIACAPKYLHVMVHKPVASTLCVQIKNGHQATGGNNTGELISNAQDVVNDWQDIVFEIPPKAIWLSYIELKLDFVNSSGRLSQDIDIYIDNIVINNSPEPRLTQENRIASFAFPTGQNGVTSTDEVFTATNVVDNISVTNINYSNNLSFNYNYKLGYFRPYNWDSEDFNENQYLEFSIESSSDYSVSVSGINIAHKPWSMTAGPQKCQLRVSTDGGLSFTPLSEKKITVGMLNETFSFNSLTNASNLIFRLSGYESLKGFSSEIDAWIIDYIDIFGHVIPEINSSFVDDELEGLVCYYAQNNIHVRGIKNQTSITLYDMLGRIAYSNEIFSDIILPFNKTTEQVYILQLSDKLGTKSFKI